MGQKAWAATVHSAYDESQPIDDLKTTNYWESSLVPSTSSVQLLEIPTGLAPALTRLTATLIPSSGGFRNIHALGAAILNATRRFRFSNLVYSNSGASDSNPTSTTSPSLPPHPKPAPVDLPPLLSADTQPNLNPIPCNSGTSNVAHLTENGTPIELASSSMSVQEMFDCLLHHGCSDLSSQIDFSGNSSIAIAGGGFGDIYRWELLNGTPVAIKTLRHHVLLRDTAPKALKAKHENVQELLGVIIFKGQLGMVSLWMDNGNLEEYIRNKPSVNRLALVHGDLKARNVLVDKKGIARLSDFDHSILSNCTLLFTETSNAGGGTLRWMAPELLLKSEDDPALSPRSKETDVYALGMTMLEIITGRVPYAEYKVDSSIIRALDKKEFPDRPKETISNGMWRLFEACWDHNPKARPSASKVYGGIVKTLEFGTVAQLFYQLFEYLFKIQMALVSLQSRSLLVPPPRGDPPSNL
ncbi:hypothetical protein FRC09_020409 [Ceratobasidium sp. 395]|nr:hypothetical protein FRC09_020409 [Ceratobasidium sp. 395]